MRAHHNRLLQAFTLLGLLLGAAVILLPFVWMLSLSLRPPDEIFTADLRLLPSRLAWENYWTALTRTGLPRALWTGAFVVAAILFFQILFAVPCAYALAQRRFRGRLLLVALVLGALLVPFQVTAVPVFLGLIKVGLINSYAGLILPFTATAFGLFLFRQVFRQIPAELFDAARVDGLSETAIVWRIAFPLALPTATAFAIFSVSAHWNDLFWPLIATTDPHLATPPRAILYFLNQEAGDDIGPLMAAAVIVVLPLVLLFLAAQRSFTRGLASAGLKE